MLSYGGNEDISCTIVTDDIGYFHNLFPDCDSAHYLYGSSNAMFNSGINRTIGWHEFIIRNTGSIVEYIIDGILMLHTDFSSDQQLFLLNCSASTSQPAYYDACFIRKFVNPEPVHGTWGTEETGTGITTFTAEDIVKLNNQNQLVLEDIINILSQKSVSAEDTISILSLSSHIPFSSEDILFALSALRTYMVTKEFITNEGAFPIIGGKHLIDVEGEN